MYLSLHTTIAIATSKFLPNPILAFFVNIVLHFIMDFIPHGDDETKEKIVSNKYDKTFIIISLVDLISSSLIIWYYGWSQGFLLSPNLPWAILGGVLPDLAMGFANFATMRAWLYQPNSWWVDWYLAFHKKIHFILKLKISKITALILQATAIVAIFWFM
jgi:hypothetical protein